MKLIVSLEKWQAIPATSVFEMRLKLSYQDLMLRSDTETESYQKHYKSVLRQALDLGYMAIIEK